MNEACSFDLSTTARLVSVLSFRNISLFELLIRYIIAQFELQSSTQCLCRSPKQSIKRQVWIGKLHSFFLYFENNFSLHYIFNFPSKIKIRWKNPSLVYIVLHTSWKALKHVEIQFLWCISYFFIKLAMYGNVKCIHGESEICGSWNKTNKICNLPIQTSNFIDCTGVTWVTKLTKPCSWNDHL